MGSMNLTDTFADSISNMRIYHHSQLINNGVSKKVLFGGASMIGLSNILPQKDGQFTFSENGKPFFITPVGKLGENNICCSNTLRLMVTEFCMISASFSPVNTNPAPPMSAAN